VLINQEVKKLTDALVKDAKRFEKEQVGLAEKKKHLVTKQKKFKKSLSDVRLLSRAELTSGWTYSVRSKVVNR
jgi:hypothetical protein